VRAGDADPRLSCKEEKKRFHPSENDSIPIRIDILVRAVPLTLRQSYACGISHGMRSEAAGEVAGGIKANAQGVGAGHRARIEEEDQSLR